jgi:hypothetical protein
MVAATRGSGALRRGAQAAISRRRTVTPMPVLDKKDFLPNEPWFTA